MLVHFPKKDHVLRDDQARLLVNDKWPPQFKNSTKKKPSARPTTGRWLSVCFVEFLNCGCHFSNLESLCASRPADAACAENASECQARQSRWPPRNKVNPLRNKSTMPSSSATSHSANATTYACWTELSASANQQHFASNFFLTRKEIATGTMLSPVSMSISVDFSGSRGTEFI